MEGAVAIATGRASLWERARARAFEKKKKKMKKTCRIRTTRQREDDGTASQGGAESARSRCVVNVPTLPPIETKRKLLKNIVKIIN